MKLLDLYILDYLCDVMWCDVMCCLPPSVKLKSDIPDDGMHCTRGKRREITDDDDDDDNNKDHNIVIVIAICCRLCLYLLLQ